MRPRQAALLDADPRIERVPSRGTTCDAGGFPFGGCGRPGTYLVDGVLRACKWHAARIAVERAAS